MTEKPYKPTLYETNKAKNTIYIPRPSKYGYQIRVNHPEILPFYQKFKEDMKIPPWCALSNDERLGFERLVLCGYYPIRLKR